MSKGRDEQLSLRLETWVLSWPPPDPTEKAAQKTTALSFEMTALHTLGYCKHSALS